MPGFSETRITQWNIAAAQSSCGGRRAPIVTAAGKRGNRGPPVAAFLGALGAHPQRPPLVLFLADRVTEADRALALFPAEHDATGAAHARDVDRERVRTQDRHAEIFELCLAGRHSFVVLPDAGVDLGQLAAQPLRSDRRLELLALASQSASG